MSDDQLHVLSRLRHIALDEACLALGECLRAETSAAERAHAIERSIQVEVTTAARLETSDAAVETFGIWLRRMKLARTEAAASLLAAEALTHEARAVVTAAHSAVEAVDELIARRKADRKDPFAG